jgi:TetR/AcrR family transcriptional repressor of nem operon
MKAGSARGAQTKRRIMETAFDLFHMKGVAATSPDEIIKASQTGKGQFYYYFTNKNDLLHQVLESHLDLIETGKAPVKHDIQSWNDLELWFIQHIELQERFHMARACPFGTIGNGLSDQDDLIRVDLCRIFEAIKSRIAAFFTKEKAQGQLAPGVNEEALADYCVGVVQGAMLMGKIKRTRHATEVVVREALAHLRQSVRSNVKE